MTRRPAGVFDRRVQIEQKTETRAAGGFGEPTVVWATFVRPWARRQIVRGTERFQAQQFEAKVDAIFELRHPVASLTSDMRLVDGSDVYDITAILPAERTGGGQELHCFTHRD